MSLSDAAETAILQHIFQNAAWANIGDATGLRGSTTAGVFYLAFHESDPGEAGTQASGETAYGSYARQPINRTSGQWNVASGVASNISNISAPAVTSGSGILTHWSIGTDISGAGNLILSGSLSPTIPYVVGTVPTISAGNLQISAS